MKKFIKQVTVKKDEAKKLERNGYILEHVMMHINDTDTYNVYEKVGK